MKIILILIMVIVLCALAVFAVIFIAGEFEKEPSPTPTLTLTPTPIPTPTPTREPGVIYITAERLCDDYDESEISADHIYKGKILEVSGGVDGINRDPLEGNYYITLDCGFWPWDHVWCYFDEADESLLIPVKIGDIVSIRGECTGFREVQNLVLLRPKLEHCTSVQLLW